MPPHTDEQLPPSTLAAAEDASEAPAADEAPTVTGMRVIPPPPMESGVTELRPRNLSGMAEDVYAWRQADAYEIPRHSAPPSDLAELAGLAPELRDTIRPGRFCA